MDISVDTDHTGVIVVDLQGDFTQARQGALAVPGTDQPYIDKVLSATKKFKTRGFKIIATQDFHPPDHISFYTCHSGKKSYDTLSIEGRTQILWPPHCVQGTKNADLLFDRKIFSGIIQKGMDPAYDSYSGFFDDGGAKTGMEDLLLSLHLNTLIVYGLATDYCVRATAMDAVKSGFNVILIEDLCQGVSDDTTRAALKEMTSAGIKIIPGISGII